MLNEESLSTLEAYNESLRTLKMAKNKIKDLDKVLAFISKMPQLTKVDLIDNEVCQQPEYREKVLEAMRKHSHDETERLILDGHDEDNISVSDDSEDDDEMDEEGEMEMMDMEIINKLDPEIRKKFENGELSLEELE